MHYSIAIVGVWKRQKRDRPVVTENSVGSENTEVPIIREILKLQTGRNSPSFIISER